MHGSHAGQYSSIISLIMKLRTLYRLPQISGIFVYTTTDLWFAGWRRGGFVAMPPRPQYKIIACYCYIRTWNRRCDLKSCKALLRRRWTARSTELRTAAGTNWSTDNTSTQVPTAVCGRIVCQPAAKFIFCRSLKRYRATWDYNASHGDELELTRVREFEILQLKYRTK